MSDKISILVQEKPKKTVRVLYRGQEHSARWTNAGRLLSVTGDYSLLQSAMIAWTGQEGEWEISEDELEKSGGGWWSKPVSVA